MKNIGFNQRFKTVEDRFFEKISEVDEEKGCWLLAGKEYGRFWNGTKLVKTHRFAFEHFIRPLGENECACHDCDNPRCVNFAHLFPGTHLENIRDCVAKKRHRKAFGESAPTAKLNDAKVNEIRALRRETGIGKYRLAARFGMAPSTIGSILDGKSWRHLL